MKKVLKWAGNIMIFLLIAAMSVLVFFSVGSRLSPDGIPDVSNYKVMVVLSGSMHPAFEAGDVIVVSSEKAGDGYKKGDIITFKDPEDEKRIVTHRVLEKVNKENKVSYRTKGDANSTADASLVPANYVIGQQSWRIPYLGRVVEFSKTKQGLIWMIFVPGVFIIFSELRSISKAIVDEIERKKQEATGETCSKE